MKWINRSIRNRILSGFSVLTLLIILLSSISFYYLRKTAQIRTLDERIAHLQVLTLKIIKKDNDFYDLESVNDAYHQQRESSYLRQRDSLNHLIDGTIVTLRESVGQLNVPIASDLDQIEEHLADYNKLFYELEDLIFQIGFKDYGTIGQMRQAAHALERQASPDQLATILQLRRHEKDFLLRNTISYAELLNEQSHELARSLAGQPEQQGFTRVLIEYTETFNELVNLHEEIGLTSHHGLRQELNTLTSHFDKELADLVINSTNYSGRIITQGTYVFAITVAVSILGSLLLSYLISNNISSPIRRLSSLMAKNIDNKAVLTEPSPSLPAGENEVNRLTQTYFKLINRTRQQFEEIRDKSEQLGDQNEALRKVNQELDRFLYSVAHDLRSPLTSVLGLLQLARHDNTDPRMTNYITMMENSIKNMERFIREIVDYAKNKKLEVTPEQVDMRAMIKEIIEDHQFMEGAEQIEKRVELSGQGPFYNDRNRLYIIFQNLISNAIRYADHHKEYSYLHISIKLSPGGASLRFEDNGVGIEPAHQKRIFEMFYRAHERSKGSGLGLYLLSESLKKLGGQIEVSSELGKGSAFCLEIPNLQELTSGSKESPESIRSPEPVT